MTDVTRRLRGGGGERRFSGLRGGFDRRIWTAWRGPGRYGCRTVVRLTVSEADHQPFIRYISDKSHGALSAFVVDLGLAVDQGDRDAPDPP